MSTVKVKKELVDYLINSEIYNVITGVQPSSFKINYISEYIGVTEESFDVAATILKLMNRVHILSSSSFYCYITELDISMDEFKVLPYIFKT